MTSQNDAMSGYQKWAFAAPLSSGESVRHDVYTKGDGPIVVIIQELPGVGRETLHLADRFVERGFRVVLPHLFGPLGRTSLLMNTARVFCMRREFSIFERNKT
ncbi:MAG: dienelactone hydrolase family protein, partial [Pseudomonadota bacterium]